MPECPHPSEFIKASKNENKSIDYECGICGDVIDNDYPDENHAGGHEHWEDS